MKHSAVLVVPIVVACGVVLVGCANAFVTTTRRICRHGQASSLLLLLPRRQQQQQQQQQRRRRSPIVCWEADLSISSDASEAATPSTPSGDNQDGSPSSEATPLPTTATTLSSSTTTTTEAKTEPRHERLARVKRLGGPFTILTPAGAMNLYGMYFGTTAIVFGLIWYVEIWLCRILYFITRNRLDTLRRLPVFFSHIWGTLVMTLTRSRPEYVNMDILTEFYKTNRAAMFVANHNSWQDIPYIGSTIGWRNYKMISKKELEKVPILSSAIATGQNVVLDRRNRRSQFMALKQGMQWLEKGVHLCTFPEGTRSKTGRLNHFKNGAFKVAHKVGAPVIPLSIVATGDIMPVDFIFPLTTSKHARAKVIVHEPIESTNKTEEELALATRRAIISGLPEHQRPL